MKRWLKEGTLKRSAAELESSVSDPATSSFAKDNCGNNKSDATEIATNEIRPVMASTSNQPRAVTKKLRKYDESYIRLGFMNDNDNPQCVICNKVLPNSSMAPAKMHRHLESVHGELKEKNVEFFIRKRDELLKLKTVMVQTTKSVNEKATEASYLVSYLIAQYGEAYSIAENLIKPSCMEMVKCVLGEKSAKEMAKIPLSNDTVAQRIRDLAATIKNELTFRLKSCKFSLQMDDSTDVTGLAILIVIVRYQHENA